MSEGKLKNCHTENIISRDCHVASLLTMTMVGLFSFSAHATCTPTPDCASIGYTETSCENQSVKCPFDTSKLFCIPCDSSFKYDCNKEPSLAGIGASCNNKYSACECIKGAISVEGNCTCDNSCSVGNIILVCGSYFGDAYLYQKEASAIYPKKCSLC